MTHITKFVRPIALRVLDEDAGLVSAVVSTEDVDRDGDVIRQEGWDLAHFSAHPILLSSHNYRGLTNQIGEWTQMQVEGSQLVGHAKYYIGEGNEEADWGFKLATKGRAAYSVGFVPDMSKAKQIEANGNLSYEYTGQELLEVSQVTVPSNPQALQAMKGMSLHPDVEMLVEEMLADVSVEHTPPPVREYVAQHKPAPVDIDAIARHIAALIKDDIRKLVHSHQHVPNIPLPDASSIVRDAIRQVIPDYREER
tara:strand:+ start:235 stop:993 length:759 start_codon:yes stop_codon:yes gene_type:complete